MTVCLYVFPPLLKHLRRVHPPARRPADRCHGRRSVQEIRGGRVDAGLLTLPVEGSDMVTVPVLREEPAVVTIPKPISWQKRRKVAARDLAGPALRPVRDGIGDAEVIDHSSRARRRADHSCGDGERGNHQAMVKKRARASGSCRIRPFAREGCGRSSFSAPDRRARAAAGDRLGLRQANRVPRIIDELLAAFEAIHGKLRLSPRRRGDGVVG